MGSAALGGAASSLLSGTWGSAEGVSSLTGFIGGACLLFGARLASGCTRYDQHIHNPVCLVSSILYQIACSHHYTGKHD